MVMGVVNLFSDLTYEGGASINGPFLRTLGASATAISVVAGLGEFLGYSIRLLSGYLSDKTGRYWVITFIGYVINLCAVPLLALAGSWPIAAAFVLTERIGRGIRKPTVESMLSYTTGTLGKGWVYALNSALDETGAAIGPLVVALVLFFKGNYRTAYAVLFLSTSLALVSLTTARFIFPVPSNLETGPTARHGSFSTSYWVYMIAGSFFAAGLMSFEFISYHLSNTRIVEDQWIPVLLAGSTVVGIVASLLLGKLYDRVGLPAVIVGVALASLFSPLVFLGSASLVIVGMSLWGIGYAVQDSLLKAIVASELPEGRRNTAFGIFYTGYGSGWLVGSVVVGILYSHSRLLLIAFSMAVQWISIPLFVLARRQKSS
jgi:MFS family permease